MIPGTRRAVGGDLLAGDLDRVGAEEPGEGDEQQQRQREDEELRAAVAPDREQVEAQLVQEQDVGSSGQLQVDVLERRPADLEVGRARRSRLSAQAVSSCRSAIGRSRAHGHAAAVVDSARRWAAARPRRAGSGT